jgi:enamine deaminase RidA (YjgF/YER057c/UK114 family)
MQLIRDQTHHPDSINSRMHLSRSCTVMSDSQITTVLSEELAPALGPYVSLPCLLPMMAATEHTFVKQSHAVKAGGFAFLSGNIPINSQGCVVPGGATEQTEQVCKNIASVLKAVETDIGNVVKVNVSLYQISVISSYFSYTECTENRSFSPIWKILQRSTLCTQSSFLTNLREVASPSSNCQRMC